MIRRDLIALEDDDLAALSNRGNVNRARRELERGDLRYQLHSAGEDLEFRWSDSVTCTIFGDHPLSDARCTCPAPGICRHIVRSVLAYQRDTDVEDVPSGPWDPGELVEWAREFFGNSRHERAHKLEEEGLVIELTRGLKPHAVFHGLGHSIKFLVPHDGRYTRCDCAEDAPCIHALLAIRAFARLDADARVGLEETQVGQPPDVESLDRAEVALSEILAAGLSNTPEEVIDRLESHEKSLREDGFVWPAEILSDIRQQHGFYHAHDARFSSERVVELVGEFAMRADAIRAIEHHTIPSLFVAGRADFERHTRLGSARLVGLGTTTRIYKNSTRMQAMLLDISSGRIVVAAHRFTHEDDRPSFADLARRLIFRGRHLHDLASGQLIIKSARLSSSHHLEIGRATASRYSQKFEWETLTSPVIGTTFREVAARLETLPPASLRPRSASEDFHVLPVASIEDAGFDARRQAVIATLRDETGDRATMIHSYLDANRDGTERLLRALESRDRLVLVSGLARLSPGGLTITLAGCVFESSDDGRYLVQPQVDTLEQTDDTRFSSASDAAERDPLTLVQRQIEGELGDACVLGSSHLQRRDRERLTDVSSRARTLGLNRAGDALARLANDGESSHLFEAAMLSRLYHELG